MEFKIVGSTKRKCCGNHQSGETFSTLETSVVTNKASTFQLNWIFFLIFLEN